MTHPQHWAKVAPTKPAIIIAESGACTTYEALEAASNRVAHLLRARGLRPGDGIALSMRNNAQFLEICWAAQRSGLYFTPVSWRFKQEEVLHILRDSGAKAVFATTDVPDFIDAAGETDIRHRFLIGGERAGFEYYDTACAAQPASPIGDQALGRDMLYSSGTTGRPKAVKQALADGDVAVIPPVMAYLARLYAFDQDTVNLTPAPLYHAGPLRYSMCLGHAGGTNIVMESFDAERMLALIEQYRITHIEVVPTMFVRLLKLPESVRRRYDISSLRWVIHGTGPCAPEVKRAIIEWLGPIVHEQYGGTEGNGVCVIDSADWLTHTGSVGKAVMGRLRIVSPEGDVLPPGEAGLVYFEDGPRFEYHGDPEKTRAAYNAQGWSTLGDIGYVDEEGFLYLTDRQSHLIISGGVNIYPQEAENVLIAHPRVQDIAVFGIPDPEFGEAVVAVVHPIDMADAGPALERELIDYCRSRIASLKCPRRIVFSDDLPRHETGKIYKRLLKDRYALGMP
jgi:acyl-CoA synthetase (AMP-forming)/AMP-acid ligase II